MIQLYNHQRTALALMRIHPRYCLFMEQGTGKSFPVLFRIAELAKTGKIASALIVAPAAVCDSWNEKITLLAPQQIDALERIDTQVISYDLAWRRLDQEQFDLVVLDESHYIKTPSAKRTKTCMRLCAKATYSYLLTGTPTSNGQLCNIWSQLACVTPTIRRGRIYPKAFGGASYSEWLRRFAYLNQWHAPTGYHDVETIQEAIYAHSFRITKAECLDLPDKLPPEVLSVELAPDQRRAYQQIRDDSAIEAMDVLADNPLTKTLRLRQIASGFIKTSEHLHEFTAPKIGALAEFIEGMEKKLVIFCDFTHSIDVVSALLSRKKIRHVILDGRTPDKGVWKTFQVEPRVQVIICQYQTGSAGIDLFAADTVLFFEPCMSSTLHEQAKDRIHRVGQHQVCSYYYLVCKNTIEEAIFKALSNYQDFGAKLFEEYLSSYRKGQKVR